jgi:hypothetical protein
MMDPPRRTSAPMTGHQLKTVRRGGGSESYDAPIAIGVWTGSELWSAGGVNTTPGAAGGPPAYRCGATRRPRWFPVRRRGASPFWRYVSCRWTTFPSS